MGLSLNYVIKWTKVRIGTIKSIKYALRAQKRKI